MLICRRTARWCDVRRNTASAGYLSGRDTLLVNDGSDDGRGDQKCNANLCETVTLGFRVGAHFIARPGKIDPGPRGPQSPTHATHV